MEQNVFLGIWTKWCKLSIDEINENWKFMVPCTREGSLIIWKKPFQLWLWPQCWPSCHWSWQNFPRRSCERDWWQQSWRVRCWLQCIRLHLTIARSIHATLKANHPRPTLNIGKINKHISFAILHLQYIPQNTRKRCWKGQCLHQLGCEDADACQWGFPSFWFVA